MKTIEELIILWDKLGNIPIDDDDCIEKPFLDFEVGTPKEEIWHWFEEQNDNFVVGEQI